MTGDRLPCCILGCRRSFVPEAHVVEMMCAKHYRSTDKRLRRMRTRLKREARKRGMWTERMLAIDSWLWNRIKRQANDRAVGI